MVFVTGGTGFIGSYLLYELLQENTEVKALKRNSSDLKHIRTVFRFLSEFEPSTGGESWEKAFDRISWVEGDILNINSLLDAMEGVDTVYHAAAVVSFNRHEDKNTFETNIQGTTNVVNACIEHGIKKLAYVSSVSALSRKKGEKINESFQYESFKFPDAYSESKYRAEMEVWRGMAEGLDVFVINPTLVLGWGNFSNSSPALFKQVYDSLKFYSTGSNGFIDARDVAKALIALTKNKNAVNKRFIACAAILSYQTLFQEMAKNFGIKGPQIKVKRALVLAVWLLSEIKAFFTGTKPFITKEIAIAAGKNYDFDTSKIKSILGYEFIPIEKTIEDTCKVFLETEVGNLKLDTGFNPA